MIDTLNFELPDTDFDHTHVKKIFEQKFNYFIDSHNKKSGKSTHVATYDNYTFKLSENKLTAHGSLTKLYFGNNVQNMDFSQVQEALSFFETTFEIPFDNAIVKRIDLAYNITLDYPVNMYMDLLATPSGYSLRLYENETKYFESNHINLHFYDKVAEAKKDDRASYMTYKHQNILKYEISYSKNLPKNLTANLNLPILTIKDLHKKEVWNYLVNQWYQGYQVVPKLTGDLPSQLDCSKLSTLKKSLEHLGVVYLGGVEKIIMAVNQKRVRRDVKHLIKNYLSEFQGAEPLSPILQYELDSKINSIYQNQLLLLD